MKQKFHFYLPIACACLSLGISTSFGATRTKAATGTDLALASAWDTLPGSADVAAWGAASLTGAQSVSSAVTWGSMSLSGHSAAITMSGSQITLASGGASSTDILTNASQALTIGNNIVATASNGAIAVGNTSTRLQIYANAATTLNGSFTATGSASANDVNLTIRGSNSGTIGGTVTVDGQVFKGDAGTWTLNGANSIGWVTINNGTLLGGNNGAFGAGTIYLKLNASSADVLTIASSNATTRNFGNKVDFASQGYTGTANFGQLTGGTGALNFGELALGTAIRNLAVNANTSFTSTSGTTGGITKTGAGTLTLSGASSTSGTTTISHASTSTTGVIVGNATALGTGAVLVNGSQQFNASLAVNDNLTVSNSLTLKRGGGGSNRAVLGLGSGSNWSGSITLDNTNSSGLATILAGASSAANASTVSGNIGFSTLGSGNNLVLRGGSSFGKISGSISLSTGTIQVLDNTQWEFSNASNTWGVLDISNSGAVITVGATNTLSSTGLITSTSGGKLLLNNFAGSTTYHQTVAGLSGTNLKIGLSAGTATLTLNTTANQSSAAVISDAISLIKSGAAKQTLTGINTYSGTTTVNQGTLALGTGGSIANTPSISLTTVGATLDVSAITFTLGSAQTLSGIGSVTGLVITGANTTTIAPGLSPGTLTLEALNAANGGTFNMELGTISDLVAITGALTGSTNANDLNFNFSAATGFASNTPYTLFTFDSQTGLHYADLEVTSLPAGVTLDPSFGTGGWLINSNNLQVQFIPEPTTILLSGMGLLGWTLRRRRS